MYAVINTTVVHNTPFVTSTHKTAAAAWKRLRKNLKEVKQANGQGSYIAQVVLEGNYSKGDLVDADYDRDLTVDEPYED